MASRPPLYPELEHISKKEAEMRKEFYMSVAAVMCSGCMALVALQNKCGTRRRRLSVEEVKPFQFPWLVSSEVIDWVAVAAVVVGMHGVHINFGLYWESWMAIYAVLVSSVVAQAAFGVVALDSAALAIFPLTSARFIRLKDKIQMVVLISQGAVGAALAVVAFGIAYSGQALMLRHYPADYIGAFFSVSLKAEVHRLDSDTWRDWAMRKLEVMTRDGKVVHAATHDLGMSIITMAMWALYGGTPFVLFSFAVTAARVVSLPLGRLVVLQRLDQWEALYVLRARIYGRAATICRCCRHRWMAKQAKELSSAGRIHEALPIHQEVLAIRTETFGERHQSTISAMSELTWSFRLVGSLQQAVDMGQKVLPISKEVLGARHPETLSAMNKLAASLSDAGRNDEALAMKSEVLEIRKETLGARHPEMLSAMTNLAISLSDAGRTEEALAMESEVLELRKEMLGARHPDTLNAMSNLAISLSDASRNEEAMAMESEVLELRKETLGARHPDTLNAMSNLAISLSDAGRTEEALAMKSEVLELWKETLGARHPDTLSAMSNLATSLSDAGRTEEALAMRSELLELRKETLGARHPATVRAMFALASSLSQAGREAEALAMRSEVVEIRKETLGARHPDTLSAMTNLAISLSDAGRTEEALAMESDVLEIRKETLGARHPDTLSAMRNLAISLSDAGRKEEAFAMESEVVKIQKETLGEGHPDTCTRWQPRASGFPTFAKWVQQHQIP